MDVGRVIPFERQRIRNRHSPPEPQAQPVKDIAEIRERHHALVRHPQHFAYHEPRLAHNLQRLAQDRRVVEPVGNRVQALVDVALHYVQPALDDAYGVVNVDVHPQAADLPPGQEQGQQFPVPAAQVQDAGPGRDHALNDREVAGVHPPRRPAPGSPGRGRAGRV